MPPTMAAKALDTRKRRDAGDTKQFRLLHEPLYRLTTFDTVIQLSNETQLIALHGVLLE
jgi:hypothetical protein